MTGNCITDFFHALNRLHLLTHIDRIPHNTQLLSIICQINTTRDPDLDTKSRCLLQFYLEHCPSVNIFEVFTKKDEVTSMHSSAMRTARVLNVSHSIPCISGGSASWGVLYPGGQNPWLGRPPSPVNRQTGVKTLPCPKVRVPAVKMVKGPLLLVWAL